MEVLVGSALFLIVSVSAYSAFISILRLANASQSRIIAVQLADEQFEIVRNMPYVNVGLTNGIPLGVLPQTRTVNRGGFTYIVTLVIRNINLATSSIQSSSKMVEVDISCPECNPSFTPVNLTGQVSPANLQSAASGGALLVQVSDSSGVPIKGATVVVKSTATSSITNTDITNDEGILQIIGVTPGIGVYRITTTKSGYSSDQTYPDANVLKGQLTQVNLFIDKLSELNINTVSLTCQPVVDFHFKLTGAKTAGTNAKYSQNLFTNGVGNLTLNAMELESYTLIPTDTKFDLTGITPFSPIKLNADSTQNIQLIAIPRNSNSMMVSVQDSVSKLPISGATVHLYDSGSYDETEMTGQGYFDQTDWSGGGGQSVWGSPSTNKYFVINSDIDTSTTSGTVVMAWNSTGIPYNLNATGTLESSTFDTGTTSNFFSLDWSPINQPIQSGSTPVKLQFATSPSTTPNGPWTYIGPDGTPDTYFSVPGMQINSSHNGDQYARYKIFMNTDTATVTPSVNDVSFTYTSGCLPPGQVIFQQLSQGSYNYTVSKSGYTSYSGTVTIVSGWQQQTVLIGL